MPPQNPGNSPRRAADAALKGAAVGFKGAALGMALLEATSLQARPAPIDGVRTNTRNTPIPTGDAYLTGRGLLNAGDVTGAMAAFRQALVDAPQSVDVLNALGVCYDRLGRYDISRTYYDTALVIEPGAALVLNNLGYSLYLQDKFAASIPILQQVTGSDDPAVAAASRRVLALVAARMRDDAAGASHAQALADLASRSQAFAEHEQPTARIETTANGEQRLVIGGSAPDRELFASLGDDAVLVHVARPWTDRDERALERRALADAAAILLAQAEAGAEDLAALAGPEAPAAVALASLADPGTPALIAARFPASIAAGPLFPTEQAGHTAPRFPQSAAALADTAPADLRFADTPAWLLASHRVAKSFAAGLVAGQEPVATVNAFDSDDGLLNAFAARMRGVALPGADTVHADAALARLRALVDRVRTA